MKHKIETTLSGSSWWKPYLLFIFLTLAVVIPFELAAMRQDTPGNTIPFIPVFLFMIVMLGLLIVIEAAFTLILGRIVVASISCNGKKAVLGGDLLDFIKLNLVCFGLTLITLGFYGPRYIKRQTDYLVEHCTIDGIGCSFAGTAKKMFKYIYLGLVLPLIVWVAIFTTAVVAVSLAEGAPGALPATLVGVLYAGLFFICTPYAYYATKWYFNISCQGKKLEWNTQFWPSFFYLSGQLLLLLVTLGIAWPVALINCWGYFGKRTIISEGDKIIYTGFFEGSKKKAFGLFWAQTLLTIITLGIYTPWAYAKCFAYLLNSTGFEDSLSALELSQSAPQA